jgi:hypothetical protein
MKLKLIAINIASISLLFLGACSNSSETANSPPDAKEETVASSTEKKAEDGKKDAEDHTKPSKGGQVVEVGQYHLEFVPEKEGNTTHLDLYLLTGNDHKAVPGAKVSAQVTLPDGTSKSVEMAYDAAGKHYAGKLDATTKGEYKVAILSDINGEKVNGRFSFTQ